MAADFDNTDKSRVGNNTSEYFVAITLMLRTSPGSRKPIQRSEKIAKNSRSRKKIRDILKSLKPQKNTLEGLEASLSFAVST